MTYINICYLYNKKNVFNKIMLLDNSNNSGIVTTYLNRNYQNNWINILDLIELFSIIM